MILVTIQQLILDAFAALVAVGGPLETVEVELFQNDIVPTPATPIGDYTLADYDGYAAEAVTWLAPSVSDAGVPELIGTVGEFRPTGSVTPNTVYGILLTDGAGGLLYAGRFDAAPLPMGSTLDVVVVTPRVTLSSGGTVSVVT